MENSGSKLFEYVDIPKLKKKKSHGSVKPVRDLKKNANLRASEYIHHVYISLLQAQDMCLVSGIRCTATICSLTACV